MYLVIKELPSPDIYINEYVHDDNPSVLTIPDAIFAPTLTSVQVNIPTVFTSSSVPIISQYIPIVDDMLPGDEASMDNCIIVVDPVDDSHDPIVPNINTVFDDDDDDSLADKIVSMLDHQYMDCILEFKVEYSRHHGTHLNLLKVMIHMPLQIIFRQ